MRIGIDARIAAYNNSGISRYFWGLLSGLEATESDFEYTVYLSRRRRVQPRLGSRFGVRYLATPPHNIAEPFLIPLELRRSECSVYHAMDFYIPTRKRIPQILSVYDLYFLLAPETLSPASYRHYRRVRRYAEQAARVVCSSESTREDLLRMTNVRPERVSVVYPGRSAIATDRSATDVLAPKGIRGAFFLAVGTIEPRKNFTRLFEAYRMAKQREPRLPPLVIVGREGFRAAEILDVVGRLGLRDSIVHFGELDDASVNALYRGAHAVVYPSLYEGFGFPLLEAMEAGAPVLSSNISSIPEVAGDAAHLVHPHDTDALADGIERLFADEPYRELLRARGRERVQRFSWKRAAQDTVNVYRMAAEER